MAKHIMSVGAHALDAELMGGPAIIKYSKHGYQGTYVHITRGERGNPNMPPEEYGKQLEKEMVKVAESLNGKAHWMGYIAGQLPSDDIIKMDLCNYIRKEKADIVISHWRGSLHPRHVLTHDAVVEAVKMAGDDNIVTDYNPFSVSKLYFGENCEDLNGFIPEIYIDITREEFNQWMEGLKNYELFRGGLLTVPYEQYYTASAKIRGIEMGKDLCKAFMLAPYVADSLD